MQVFDDAERRARELCERAGIPWNRADASAWMALADMERKQASEHEPATWQILAIGVVCFVGGTVALWYAATGGGA